MCSNCYFFKQRLVKLVEEGFKRLACWNEYQTKIETRNSDKNNLTRFPLDASFQGVKRLFVLAFNNTNDDAKKLKGTVTLNAFFQE